MARFLSAEWMAAVSAPDPEPLDGDLRIHQVVTGAPEGDIEYTVVVRGDGGGTTIVPRPPTSADVRIAQTYATALAIHVGELAIEDALASGKLRITGDTARLVAAAAALTAAVPHTDELRKRGTDA